MTFAFIFLIFTPSTLYAEIYTNPQPWQILLCDSEIENFNNYIYDFWLKGENAPTVDLFVTDLQSSLDLQKIQALEKNGIAELSTFFYEYYQFITFNSNTELSNKQKLEKLTALEVGDHSTNDATLAQAKWLSLKNRLAKFKTRFTTICESYKINKSKLQKKTTTTLKSFSGAFSSNLSRPLLGLHVSLATTYQSCSVLDLPPVTQTTPDTEGVIITGKHPDGIGNKREYENASKILETHYYYKNLPTLENACYLPKKSPLIYDYGGKPRTTSDDDAKLDFFADEGTGTDVLGLDCSGFIFSVIARAGLRIEPNRKVKAVYVHGISAHMYRNPSLNGLSCFAPIKLDATHNIASGDIVASDGHVFMLDNVENDPLGIQNIKSKEDCQKSKISTDQFNFNIVQSSPYKNAIGIGKAKASDYLKTYAEIKIGFEAYALHACQAQFNTASITPKVSEITIVRHKNTPECLNSTYVPLNKEECVIGCVH